MVFETKGDYKKRILYLLDSYGELTSKDLANIIRISEREVHDLISDMVQPPAQYIDLKESVEVKELKVSLWTLTDKGSKHVHSLITREFQEINSQTSKAVAWTGIIIATATVVQLLLSFREEDIGIKIIGMVITLILLYFIVKTYGYIK